MTDPGEVGRRPLPASCAAESLRLGEPLAGTAPVARSWLCVEHLGPWGERPLAAPASEDPTVRTGPPGLGAVLAELVRRGKGAGVGVLAIRRPHARPGGRAGLAGSGGGPAGAGGWRAVAASTVPGRTGVTTLRWRDPTDLLGLDLAALGAGRLPAGGEPTTGPLLLVCANGRRDACCAVAGRALAAVLARSHPTQVWECSHLGGHRFAPTALALPTGYCYGRLTATDARALLRAPVDGPVALAGCRGRTTWAPAAQAAELIARAGRPELGPDAVTVTAAGDGRFRVAADDGTTWTIAVEQRAATPARPVRCGDEATQPVVSQATVLAA